MSYPPQPGQPYGQAGARPGGYPRGGYPQQGGQFPPGYPQHQPFPPGYPQPQPPKKKTGLWIGLTAAVVVVAAFVVTAFVAPGFLLGDDEPAGQTTAAGTADSGAEVGEGPAAELAQRIAQGFRDHDEDGLNRLVCSGSEVGVEGFTREAEMYQEFTFNGKVQGSGGTASVTAHVVLEGEGQRVEGDMVISLADENGWCLKDLEKARD
jgi:hypothetical protein